MDRLQQEPARLSDMELQLDEEIKNLTFSNYKTFIRTAQCSSQIYSDFSLIETHLDNSLLKNLPQFEATCDSFTRNIQSMTTARRNNNLTLQRHNQLLEILEISQLMDTCVRNEYYDEALELADYVRRLEKKYADSIPLIQRIVDDVNKSQVLMLKQLMQQLKTNVKFDQCLHIVGFIRRLGVFTENELRIRFLQLRDAWFKGLLQAIPKQDPYNHILKTIDENRTNLFEIITQYRSIFSDDDLLGNTATMNNNFTFVFTGRNDSNESRLFYTWLHQKIQQFLDVC
jgi:conserved oligomeric Golgi complex subunit 8